MIVNRPMQIKGHVKPAGVSCPWHDVSLHPSQTIRVVS